MHAERKEVLLGVCSCCWLLDLLFIRPLVVLNLNGIYDGHVLVLYYYPSYYAAKRGIAGGQAPQIETLGAGGGGQTRN